VIVVADAGIFLLLHEAGQLDLLHALFGEVLTTSVVADEVQSFDLGDLDWVSVVGCEFDEIHQELVTAVDAGEASAIWLALRHQPSLLLIDDLAGRKESSRRGVRVAGSLGVLAIAKQRGIIARIAPLVDSFVQAGAWYSPRLISMVLQRADES